MSSPLEHGTRAHGCLAEIVFELAAGVVPGSWYALLVDGIGALLIVLRARKEERELPEGLKAYRDFSRGVRCRLIPGTW
jgi:protein-S-isoprenylcysteine O-methyltransferase Ste14